jgi:hypothetical protein
MNGLLDAARGILADLVRKRLWPIAIVLLIALVAVPVMITSSSSVPAAPVGDGVVAPATPQPMPVAASDSATAKPAREPAGRVRDPFFDPPAAPAEGAGAATKTSEKSAGEPAKAATAKQPATKRPPPAAKAKPAEPTTVTPPSAEPSAPATGVYFRTAARVGPRATTHPITRLTPVGNRWDPAALYLGVMKLGRPYAVFVLGRRATSRGDATCATQTRCRIIGLRPGDTQTVTVHTADGRTVRRIVVHVTSVKPVTRSAGRAGAVRAAVHPAGRSAMRAMSRSDTVAAALGRLGFRQSTGLLYSIAAAEAAEKATR